jgi:hypothetical protein
MSVSAPTAWSGTRQPINVGQARPAIGSSTSATRRCRPSRKKRRERQITDLQKTVATLTERLSSLERAPDGKDGTNSTPASRVFAPFEVLDKMGHPILRVSDEQAAVGLKSASRVLLTRGAADNHVLQFRTAYGVCSASIGESATGNPAALGLGLPDCIKGHQ